MNLEKRAERATLKTDANSHNHPRLGRRRTKEGNEVILTKELRETKTEKLWMRPAAMDDLHEAVKLFEICANEMIGTSDVNPDDIKNEWQMPKFSLEESVRVVLNPHGQMVGYIEVWDIDATPVRVWVWHRVHPDYENNHVGDLLLDWAERRARKAIHRVPNDLRVTMEVGIYHNYREGQDRLDGRGMKMIRQFLTMSIELDQPTPEPQLPQSLRIQTMNGRDETISIIKAVREAFQDHWGYVEQPFEESLERWRHFMDVSEDFDPGLWFIARDGDEIAGVSLCWPKANEDPEMGWVGTLGVRKKWRKRGLGLALLHHSFKELARRGQKRVGLGVDGKSLTGATRLYEKAGMNPVTVRQMDLYSKTLRPGRDISRQEL